MQQRLLFKDAQSEVLWRPKIAYQATKITDTTDCGDLDGEYVSFIVVFQIYDTR